MPTRHKTSTISKLKFRLLLHLRADDLVREPGNPLLAIELRANVALMSPTPTHLHLTPEKGHRLKPESERTQPMQIQRTST